MQTTTNMAGVVLAAALVTAAVAGSAGCQQAPPPAAPAQGSQTPGSQAMTSTTQEVLDRHMKTFGSQDVPGVLADYADDAVMFTANGPVKGKAALKPVFEGLFVEWGKPGVKFDLKQQTVEGNVAVIFWNAETPDNVYEGASDAFVVSNGKIVSHIFSGKITPKAAAKK